MFNVSSYTWFAPAKAAHAKKQKLRCCIDLGCLLVNQDKAQPRNSAVEDQFKDEDIVMNERGMHIEGEGGMWSRLLASASGASSRVADDSLSTASTHQDDDEEVSTMNNTFLRSLSVSSGGQETPSSFTDIRKIRKIGEGDTSEVWHCEDSNHSSFAVKCISLSREKRSVNLVVEEIVMSRGIKHPSVITCHNVFFTHGSFHLVMEFMDGGSLLQAMKRNNDKRDSNMPAAVLAHVAENILSALQFLHDELNTIHRDVKPGNILLSTCGKVKLADLGIATSPSSSNYLTNEWVGTTTYMSPERLRGEDYSFSADLWSLGLMLVEMALGRYPLADPALCRAEHEEGGRKRKNFDFWDLLEIASGPCPARVLKGHGNQEWDALVPLVTACLAKNPAQRPRAATLLAGRTSGCCGANFLARADSRALALWVKMGLTSDDMRAVDDDSNHSLVALESVDNQARDAARPLAARPLAPWASAPITPPLVDEAGAEEDGWL